MSPVTTPQFTDLNPRAKRHSAFTLIELLAVIAIIGLLVAATIPTIKGLTRSNDQKQAANLARSMIGSARTFALSQHRMAGVVFFEEGNTSYSSASKSQGQTAMQLFVEDYNQVQHSPASGITIFNSASPRQYLPGSIKVAALDGTNFEFDGTKARAILFDANGQLLMRGGLGSDPGFSARAAGDIDWQFVSLLNPTATFSTAISSPGFFLYNKGEFAAANLQTDPARIAWLQQNADIIILNVYTGTVIR